jgi:hypothetical protein
MQVKIVRLNPQLNLSGHTEARNPIKEPGKKQGKEMHGAKHPGKQQRRCRKKKGKDRAKKRHIEHRVDLLSWYHTLSCGFAVMHSATPKMDALLQHIRCSFMCKPRLPLNLTVAAFGLFTRMDHRRKQRRKVSQPTRQNLASSPDAVAHSPIVSDSGAVKAESARGRQQCGAN